MTVSSPKASAIGPNLLVHAYVDGELDAASALDLKQQIDADPAMAAEAANISALQGVLRSKLTPEQVPPGLRSRIRRAVGLSRWRDRPTWGALAASIITAVLVSSSSTWLVLHNPAALIVNEIVDNHLGALIASRPTDVSSSDRHTVKPWFGGKLSYAPKVVDLSPAGFPLVGARIDVVRKTPIATLVYQRRLHVISLSAVPSAVVLARLESQNSNGYNIESWSENGTSYWAVSDLNAGELDEFAKAFRNPQN